MSAARTRDSAGSLPLGSRLASWVLYLNRLKQYHVQALCSAHTIDGYLLTLALKGNTLSVEIDK